MPGLMEKFSASKFWNRMVFLFFIFCANSQAQGYKFIIPDSLRNVSYQEIINRYEKSYDDSLLAKVYLGAHYKRALDQNNLLKQAISLHYLSYHEKQFKNKIQLIDSSIAISQFFSHKYFPSMSYSFKGGYYLEEGRLNDALDNFILTMQSAEKRNNPDFVYIAKHNIANVKGNLGKYSESLNLFKECYDYEKSREIRYSLGYYETSAELSGAYLRNQMTDSAFYLINEGKRETKNSYPNFYHHFIILEGIYHFQKQNYSQAKINLRWALSKLNLNLVENQKYLILANYYLGKCYKVRGNNKAALQNLFKIDSMAQSKPIVMPEIRRGYDELIDIFKKRGDTQKQLLYIDRLLRYDSIEDRSKIKLGDVLSQKFDTPILIKEKQQVINKLDERRSWMIKFVFGLITLLVLIVFLLILQYRKRKKYKHRYLQLINKTSDSSGRIPNIKKENQNDSNIGISQEIISDISEKIEMFELRKEYLKKNMTIVTLAKKLSTNTKYLSRIINYTKQKHFTAYINDLRIDFVVEELKKNKKLRQYTISGIAQDIGFNNAAAFSAAFRRATGIKPSYYIKRLNDKDKG